MSVTCFDSSLYRLSCCPTAVAEDPPTWRPNRGHLPERSPRWQWVKIAKASLRKKVTPGVIQFSVFGASGDCTLTSVNPSIHRSAEIRQKLTVAGIRVDIRERRSVTCVSMSVCIIHWVGLCPSHSFSSHLNKQCSGH